MAATPFDVFMIAYGEPNAAENWARLRSLAPQAQRVENVPGLTACYAACADASRTPWFFAVDADNWMLDGFHFEVPFAPKADEIVHWYAQNPVNGLRYAHGAIKLIPVALMARAMRERHLDFSVSVARNRYTGICASEHRFNSDPYNAWAAAFRECAKLAIGTGIGGADSRRLARTRLAVWCNRGADARFGEWCLRGAREGRRYGLDHARDLEWFERINDYDWLRSRFRAAHVRKIAIPPQA